MKNTILGILKEFEQQDYKRGGTSIAPTMYEAIASKIEKNLLYTDSDINLAYSKGQNNSTFYKKDGTVLLPRNYEGVDG